MNAKRKQSHHCDATANSLKKLRFFKTVRKSVRKSRNLLKISAYCGERGKFDFATYGIVRYLTLCISTAFEKLNILLLSYSAL